MQPEWSEIPLIPMQSTLTPWKGCSAAAPRGTDNVALPCSMEFHVVGPNGSIDRQGKGEYKLAGPGGYKLSSGVIRPFPQATSAPIMLVCCPHTLYEAAQMCWARWHIGQAP